jgi:hypothetical protein
LTWDDPDDDTIGYYEIYINDSSTPAQSVAAPATSFTIDGLSCETEYSFHIIAVSGDLKSDPSNTATATTGECSNPNPNITDLKPENIWAETGGEGVINLCWDAVDGATGYDIYDCDGNYITSTSYTSYSFTGLPCSTEFCYYVIAHDGAGNKSKPSDQVTVSTEACEEPVTVEAVTSLISTGTSLWFNILIAIFLIIGIGYFMFRNEIHGVDKNKKDTDNY